MRHLQKHATALATVALAVLAGGVLGSHVGSREPTASSDVIFSGSSWAESFDSIDEQFARAHVVVLARVSKEARDASNGGFPVVETEIRVLETFKGSFKSDETIVVHQAGKLAMPDSELPFLSSGNEYLLFLTQQFAGQPQHYILGPTALFMKGAQGRYYRAANVDSKIPLFVALASLRHLNPVRVVDLKRPKVYTSLSSIQADADAVVVVELESDPVQREAEAIPTVSLELRIVKSLKGELAIGEVIDFGMLADLRGKLVIQGGYPDVPRKGTQYLMFLTQRRELDNFYWLVEPAGMFEAVDEAKFVRSFSLDTAVIANISLTDLT